MFVGRFSIKVCFYKAIHKVSIKPSMRHILWVAALLGASDVIKIRNYQKTAEIAIIDTRRKI